MHSVPLYKSKKPGSVASLRGGRSVVHLLKPIVALIVTPIDKYGSVINAGAMLAPTFKSHMGLGQGSYGRSLPREIALGPIGAENHYRTSVAVPIAPGLVLSSIPYIEDADGPHEIELRSADIDVRAILNKLKGPISENEVIRCFWSAPSSLNRCSGTACWIRLSRSSAVVLEKRFIDAVYAV